MILPTGSKPARNAKRAFTLVELILVMALLVVVLAVASPSLAGFFRGRAIETEAGRFLATIRYAQNRAVSAGRPMVLWIDRQERTYGLKDEWETVDSAVRRPLLGMDEEQFNEEQFKEFELATDLRFEFTEAVRITNGLINLRFAPDGSVDEENLQQVLIQGKDPEAIPILLTRSRLTYEIGPKTNLWGGRRN